MPTRPFQCLLLLACCLMLTATGCQRWATRLESLRDPRVGEIEHNLGADDSSGQHASNRDRAMPSFTNSE